MLPQWSPPYLAIFKALMKLLSFISQNEFTWEVPVLSTLAPSTLCREHFSESFWGCDSEGWNCWTAQILPMSWAKWHWGGNQLHFAAARCFSESGATHWWNWGALERRSFLQKNHVETLHLDLRPCLKHAPFRPFWPFGLSSISTYAVWHILAYLKELKTWHSPPRLPMIATWNSLLAALAALAALARWAESTGFCREAPSSKPGAWIQSRANIIDVIWY